MGNSVSKLLDKLFGSKEMRLLMLGLDAAGKTSTPPPPHFGLADNAQQSSTTSSSSRT